MARVICSVCGNGNANGATDCEICGNPLPAARPPAPAETITVDTSAVDASAVDDSASRCPTCAAVIPNPANRMCVECLEPLIPQSPPDPPPSGCRLVFPGRPIDVPRPGSVLLGRDPDQSPVAEYFTAHDNVSRRHASVGAESDGKVWVRDEYSANGTFVNDNRVPAGQTVPLADGDRLRMASNLVATIELGRST